MAQKDQKMKLPEKIQTEPTPDGITIDDQAGEETQTPLSALMRVLETAVLYGVGMEPVRSMLRKVYPGDREAAEILRTQLGILRQGVESIQATAHEEYAARFIQGA